MKLKPTRIEYAFEEVPYDPATDKPWLTQDGTDRWWYSNGQLMYETSYINGQRHGLKKTWYSNGQLEYETPYINGQEHGLAKGWYDNGQLRYEYLYVYGEPRDSNMPRLEQVIYFGKVLETLRKG